MYYTVSYFTGLFYAVVRHISTLFIDNKDSVFCNTLSYKDFANNLDHNKPLTSSYQICETTHLHRRKWHQADRPHLSRNPTQNHRRLCRLKNLLDCKQKNNKTLADDCDTSHYKIHKQQQTANMLTIRQAISHITLVNRHYSAKYLFLFQYYINLFWLSTIVVSSLLQNVDNCLIL